MKPNKLALDTCPNKEFYEVIIRQFLKEPQQKERAFDKSLTKYDRACIHELAKIYGLKSKSTGKNENRYITVYKYPVNSKKTMEETYTTELKLQEDTYECITKFKDEMCFVSPKDQDVSNQQNDPENIPNDFILKSQSVFDAAKVPPVRLNKYQLKFREKLPIFSSQANIIESINTSSVTIISGETGCGKTTQVPQMILEDAQQNNKPVKIICSMPKRISVRTVSDRVAYERNEKIGNTVGFQIRLNSRISDNTLLTFCTHGVLLRYLFSKDSLLSSVTHIIMDEIHERDRLSDFSLIILREALIQYPKLKIILMSATADINLFAKYFEASHPAIITVHGKRNFKTTVLYLEDILKLNNYYYDEIEETVIASPSLSSLKKQAAIPLNLIPEIDRCLANAMQSGSKGCFNDLMALYKTKKIPLNYQHSETGITGLMAAAAHSNYDVAEDLVMARASVRIFSFENKSCIDYAKELRDEEMLSILDPLEQAEKWFSQSSIDPAPAQPHEEVSEDEEEKELSKDDIEQLKNYELTRPKTPIHEELIVELLLYIHKQCLTGAILIFLPGYEEIMAVKNRILHRQNDFGDSSNLSIVILHSRLEMNAQREAFSPAPAGIRKIILATNIAETSVTIEDVGIVIDCGKAKEKNYNPITGAHSLDCEWISKASARQRKGRAGRTCDGFCFRLYSSWQFKQLVPAQTPEILRVPLQELCLQAKQLASTDMPIAEFLDKAIEPPTKSMIENAVNILKLMGALDNDENLTDLGHLLVHIPLDPRFGKMVIYSIILKCLDPVLYIVCGQANGEIFRMAKDVMKTRLAKKQHKFSIQTMSDHMVYLQALENWEAARVNRNHYQWCEENFLNSSMLEYNKQIFNQILNQLLDLGLIIERKDVNTYSDNWATVKAAITAGLYPNIAKRRKEFNELFIEKRFKVQLHASSVLRHNGIESMCDQDAVKSLASDWVIFDELHSLGNNSKIRTCTVVSTLTVFVFAGQINPISDSLQEMDPENTQSEEMKLLEEKFKLQEPTKISLDEWLVFDVEESTAPLVMFLRSRWNSLVKSKLRIMARGFKGTQAFVEDEEDTLNLLMRVLNIEEQALKLPLNSNLKIKTQAGAHQRKKNPKSEAPKSYAKASPKKWYQKSEAQSYGGAQPKKGSQEREAQYYGGAQPKKGSQEREAQYYDAAYRNKGYQKSTAQYYGGAQPKKGSQDREAQYYEEESHERNNRHNRPSTYGSYYPHDNNSPSGGALRKTSYWRQ